MPTQQQQQQQEIYAIIPDNSSWEDIIIFLSLKDAETSLNNDFPQRRIEHFIKSDQSGGYIPSYLVTYGKNWGMGNQMGLQPGKSQTQTQPQMGLNKSKSQPQIGLITQSQTYPQLGVKEGLPIYTKYYQLSETENEVSKYSLR